MGKRAKAIPGSFLSRALEALGERHPDESPTQTKLAKIAGVSQPTAHEWGLPDRAPSHDKVLKIAGYTGICVEWLYTGRGPKRPPPLDPFIQRWLEMDDEMRREISNYYEFLISRQPKRP
jgi:hypothetical protein